MLFVLCLLGVGVSSVFSCDFNCDDDQAAARCLLSLGASGDCNNNEQARYARRIHNLGKSNPYKLNCFVGLLFEKPPSECNERYKRVFLLGVTGIFKLKQEERKANAIDVKAHRNAKLQSLIKSSQRRVKRNFKQAQNFFGIMAMEFSKDDYMTIQDGLKEARDRALLSLAEKGRKKNISQK